MKRFLFVFVQWTYALPQTLAGLFVLLYFHFIRKSPVSRHRLAVRCGWPRRDGLSLGMFIFTAEDVSPAIRDHEYGHSLQSLILGPLYLPVIGLPSLVWANARRASRPWRSGRKDYYAFYPERWANRLGRSSVTSLTPRNHPTNTRKENEK